MTRFINTDETASLNVADLLTTNSKVSYEIFLFQNGPHLILDSITRTTLSAPRRFCYQWRDKWQTFILVCLLLFEIFDFRKVYWSPRSVCYFSKSSIFEKYIGHRGLCVCVSACLSVRLQMLYRPHRLSDRPDFVCKRCLLDTRQCRTYFFWKSDKGQGQGHHFCENQIMGHNLWTGSDRDFWLVAQRAL